MDGRAECSVCGSREPLRADGKVRKHNQLLMGVGGVHRSGFVREGTGQLPEPAEELAAVGGA